MTPRLTLPTGTLVAALLTGGLLTGCSEAQDTADRVRDCTALATDVARAGLSGVPTADEAEQAADAVHERLSRLTQEVHDPAVALHDRLHAIEEARRDGDVTKATRAARQAREAAGDVAAACGLSVERFIGTG